MQYQLEFGSKLIHFSLEYAERKTLGIKVYPDGSIQVLAPVNSATEEVLKKVRKKAPWILKQLDFFEAYKPATPERRFVNGETHLYLGRQYRLKIVQDNVNVIKFYRGQLIIHANNTHPRTLKKQLNAWYIQRAKIIFNELLEETFPKFNKYNLVKPELIVRVMSKRWGSCTPSGKIILNPELIKASRGSIEYVIIHELTHLVHHNHTRAFHELQSKILPDWEKRKERLEMRLV